MLPEGTIPQASCRTPAAKHVDAIEVARVKHDAEAAGRDGRSAEAFHVLGLLELPWRDGAGKSLGRAISSLQAAAQIGNYPAPVLADLTAAYLVRAEQMQTPRDLLEAIEAAERALTAEPQNLTARYNLALALDRNGLDARATAAWNAYLRLDSTSSWAEEARARVRALQPRAALPPPTSASDVAGVKRFASRAPQDAQLLGWDHVLGEWGDAVIERRFARAHERLGFAQALGAALESQGGDATLIDAVRWIHARSGDPASLRRLARAHREYARARADYVASRRDAAGGGFARVRAATVPGSPLHQWATVFHGGIRGYQDPATGEPILRRAAEQGDTLRHPALAGRARWLLGTSLLRQGRYPEARLEYRTAARLFTRAGEREHLGAVQVYTGTAEHHLANPAAAYASLHAGLMTLRPYRSSTWLHSALWAHAAAAAGDGYLRATAHILDEDVAVTTRSGDPVDAAEARTTRARLLTATGFAGEALEDLKIGLAAALARVEPAQARAWFQTEVWEAEAAAVSRTAPLRARALLDSAVLYWTSQGNVLRLLPPLVARTELHLALWEMPAAERDLDRVLALLGSERGSIASAPERIPLLDAVQAAVGRLVMLRMARGEPGRALLDWDRARTALLPVALSQSRAPAGRVRGPREGSAVVHALVGDTLLIWTVRDTTVRTARRTVNRAALLDLVKHARSLLERSADEEAVRPALQALYEHLIRPVEAHLGEPESPLLLLPDAAVEGVPFAALYEARRGRYLVEDHPLRFGAALRSPGREAGGRRAPRARALLVAATEFDERSYPELEPLPDAEGEVRALERGYSDAVVLLGAQATPAALLSALPRAALVHYAGHALLDDEHPERSRLILAPDMTAEGRAELTAGEIERLRLPEASLVVLAACQTLSSPTGRTGGFAGLAVAFLAAGADGVVGSLWKVDDRATRPLMTEFHRAYRRRPDGAAALRSAQLQMLRARDSRTRSPTAWAAFRYTGH